MERFNAPKSNLNPNFIGLWTIKPFLLCDNLVDYFEANLGKQKRGVSSGGVNTEVKDTIDIKIKPKDIILPGNEIFKEYFKLLFECHEKY